VEFQSKCVQSCAVSNAQPCNERVAEAASRAIHGQEPRTRDAQRACGKRKRQERNRRRKYCGQKDGENPMTLDPPDDSSRIRAGTWRLSAAWPPFLPVSQVLYPPRCCLQWHREQATRDFRCAPQATREADRCCLVKEAGSPTNRLRIQRKVLLLQGASARAA